MEAHQQWDLSSGAQPGTWANQLNSSTPWILQSWLAMLQTLTGIRLRPQGSGWLQSHTWTVPLLHPPLPVLQQFLSVEVPRQGQILLPMVVPGIGGSQINISYDLRSL